MGTRVVDQNSVQSQFTALERDREVLRNATNAAERDRRHEEETLRNLRATESALADKLRVAHAALGTETKKRQLLREEEARLRKVLEDDRRAIVELTRQLEGLEEEDRARKAAFVKEMDALNDELESELRQYEERKWMKIITVESVELLIQEQATSPSSSAANDSSDSHDNQAQKLNDALELLKEATSKFNHEVETKQTLEGKVRALRSKALQCQGSASDEGGEPLNEIELDELERLWEQAWENEVEDADMCDGSNENPATSESASTSHNHHINDMSLVSPKNQPVNMNLFYGDGLEDIVRGHEDGRDNTEDPEGNDSEESQKHQYVDAGAMMR